MEKKSLGRGIGALIAERDTERQEKVMYVPLEQIRPNPFQPREVFEQHHIEELAQSIREKGIIQPVLVRRKGEQYELIAGERRFRAAGLLNLKEMPVIVKEVGDQDSLELSLIENIQREDLNPIEEAHAYQYLIDKFHVTQEKLGEILGKARVSVTNTLRLLTLPLEVQDEIKLGRLSFAHGKALLELADANQQRRLMHEAIAKGLSVKELESMVKKHRPKLARRSARHLQALDPKTAAIEEQLQQTLATKVTVSRGKKRGRILIEFYSQEDLHRIAECIRRGGTS